MARAKKTTEPAEKAEVKDIDVKEETPKAEEKKPAAKKTAAKKPVAKKESAAKKPAAKKADAPEESRKVFIQNGMGGEIAGTKLIEKAKEVAGVKNAKSVDVYVRFDINRVYYVIDTTINGSFELF